MRNLALDFLRCPGAGISIEEMKHYCEWRGIAGEDKKLLHQALTQSFGARIAKMRFWHVGETRESTFYMGISWNWKKEQCHDLEDLINRDRELFLGYQPFLEMYDESEKSWKKYAPAV